MSGWADGERRQIFREEPGSWKMSQSVVFIVHVLLWQPPSPSIVFPLFFSLPFFLRLFVALWLSTVLTLLLPPDCSHLCSTALFHTKSQVEKTVRRWRVDWLSAVRKNPPSEQSNYYLTESSWHEDQFCPPRNILARTENFANITKGHSQKGH